jgi:hypothetical protein
MSGLNRNVGIGGLDVGLVMIPAGGGPDLFEIDVSEFGMLEATMKFATFNPALYPKRTTKCPDFHAVPNSETSALLALLPYLAAQSTKIRFNGEGVGVHGVDVLCQGANFDTGLSAAPVVDVPITNRGQYTAVPSIVFSGGNEVQPAHAGGRLQLKTIAIAAAGSGYIVGDVLRLLGGTFDTGCAVRVIVDTVSGGGAVTSFHVWYGGKYSVIPANAISTADGTGTGATFNLTWQLGYVVITDGGSYRGTPNAAAEGGVFTIQATLGTPSMGQRVFDDSTVITKPFDPVTTVKDTAEFEVRVSADSNTLQARACTLSLPAYTHGTYSGYDGIQANADGLLPPQDGVVMNQGDFILVTDGTEFSGLYKVAQVGQDPNFPYQVGRPWILIRSRAMDESSEVNNSVKVAVAEGNVNVGLWQCTVTGSFAINVNPITFDQLTSPAELALGYKVTVEYHAIELSYEYMAEEFASEPRFLEREYVLVGNGGGGGSGGQSDVGIGDILINRLTGRTMNLEIDSVKAITQTVDATGNVIDGPEIAIDQATWLAAVKFVGTAAQFEQTPAGAYYHVKETTTIKIVGIIAAGSVIQPTS